MASYVRQQAIEGKTRFNGMEKRNERIDRRDRYLLVVAGGSGTRMGASVPKQFIELKGKAVLRRTIEKFVAASPDIRIVTVLPEPHISWWKEYCIRNSFICPQKIVKGGLTRFHSVRNGLSVIPDGALVAVHDGVRPLLSEEMISGMFSVAEDTPGVVPVVPCVDTMKALRKDPETGELYAIDSVNVDRSVLYAVQTPQIFHSELLKKAYSLPFDTSFTDDASVAAKNNIPLTYVPGEKTNIKLTTPEDLVLAQAILSVEN